MLICNNNNYSQRSSCVLVSHECLITPPITKRSFERFRYDYTIFINRIESVFEITSYFNKCYAPSAEKPIFINYTSYHSIIIILLLSLEYLLPVKQYVFLNAWPGQKMPIIAHSCERLLESFADGREMTRWTNPRHNPEP